MTRPRVIGMLLALPVLVVTTYAGLLLYSRYRPEPPTRVYEVRYAWDDGVKSVEIVDPKTGKKEWNPLWRLLAIRDAKKVLPGLLRGSGLRHTRGRFLIDFWDFDEPFLGLCPGDREVFIDTTVTPLLTALAAGDEVKARRFIADGAEVNRGARDRTTPLMSAGITGCTEGVKLLLAAGADVNARTLRGETALSLAEDWNRKSVARLLRQAGAKK